MMSIEKSFECGADVCPCRVIGPDFTERAPTDQAFHREFIQEMAATFVGRQAVGRRDVWVPMPDKPQDPVNSLDIDTPFRR